MVDFQFDYDFEAMGVVLGVDCVIDPGEKANINLAEPENAYPGSGPQVVRLSAYAKVRDKGYPDVNVKDIAVRSGPGAKWQSLEEYLSELAVERYTENCD